MKFLLFNIIVSLLLLNLAIARVVPPLLNDSARYYLESRNEVYFSFLLTHVIDKKILSRTISIDRVVGDTVFAYANTREFENFLKFELPYNVLIPPSMIEEPKMMRKLKSTHQWDEYPNYDNYISMMEGFALVYPELCSLINIGKSVNNRDLLVARITGSDAVEYKPSVFYSATMHGDETAGYLLMLRLIDYLLQQYTLNTGIKNLIDSVDIYINPLANPDGTFYTGNGTIYGATRSNANGVDLNRNFPDPAAGLFPDGNNLQPENEAMMNFMQSKNFTLSANFHGGAEVVNYPWDTWERRHADDEWFIGISTQYADTAQHYGHDDYFTSVSPTGVINGYDWYTIAGSRQDYVTYFLKGRETTIELTINKIPPAGSLPAYWEYNYRSLINYISSVKHGLHGKILDAQTKKPIMAKIELGGYDVDNSHVYTNTSGHFHRLLPPGNYNLNITVPGYQPNSITDLNLDHRQRINMEIEMEPAISNFYTPRIIDSYGNPIDTITQEFDSGQILEICFSMHDEDGHEAYLTDVNSYTGNGSVDLFHSPSKCLYYIPNKNFAGIDTLQVKFCDYGYPQLCDSVILILRSQGYNNGDSIRDIPPEILVYPNPCFDKLEVEVYFHETTTVQFSIIDMTGSKVKTIQERVIEPGLKYLTFETNHLNPGIYLLTVTSKEFQLVKKFLKLP